MGDLNPNPSYRVAPAAPPTEPVRDPLGATVRLVRWGGALARHDALIPREIERYARLIKLSGARVE